MPSSRENQGLLAPEKRKWFRKWWKILLFLISIIFLSLLFAFGFYILDLLNNFNPSQSQNNQVVVNQINQKYLFRVGNPSLGPADAKIVIVEFSDFQCPFCQQEYFVVKEVLKKYQNQIKFIFRHFPLISDHPQSLTAALAANCAQKQGGFWAIYDKIFQNPQNLDDLTFKKYAEQLGLDSLEFNDCLDAKKYLSDIEKDLEDGLRLGVSATPFFFINGIMIKGAIPLEVFEQMIEAEINK